MKLRHSLLTFAAMAGIFAAIVAAAEWVDPRTSGGVPTVEWKGRMVRSELMPTIRYPADIKVVDESGGMLTHRPAYWAKVVDETIEIGLRSDGVVVWRKVKD